MDNLDKISNEGLFEMIRDKLNLIRALVDEAQRLTVNMGFIEHHGEIRVKVAEIKPIIKEMESRFLNSTNSVLNSQQTKQGVIGKVNDSVCVSPDKTADIHSQIKKELNKDYVNTPFVGSNKSNRCSFDKLNATDGKKW